MLLLFIFLQLYNRRKKVLKGEKEALYWSQISHTFMSNESSEDEGGTVSYIVHRPKWRSQGFNVFDS